MFETSVDVAAPLDDAWSVFVDVERWPEWTASMSKVTLLGDGPLAVGSRVRIKQPRLPPAVWQVTDLDLGRGFTWRAPAPGVTTVADHRLSAAGADRVTVTLSIRRSGPLGPLVDALFRGVTRRYVVMEAEGLKARCEASR